MKFGQGHGLAVWRPSLELSFLTQHFNQVQSHFLISTTLNYPANGYHVLDFCSLQQWISDATPQYLATPLYNTLPLLFCCYNLPGLPYNWQPTCAKFHSAEWWEACWKNFSPSDSAKTWCYERCDALCPNVCQKLNLLNGMKLSQGVLHKQVANYRVALADCSNRIEVARFYGVAWQISTTRVCQKPVHGTRLQGKLGLCRLKSVIEPG